jgi:hypothetical protein
MHPILLQKWVFNFILKYFMVLFNIFGDFWPILGDIGPFLANIGGFLANIGGVGRWLPTSDLYKPGLLEAMGGHLE